MGIKIVTGNTVDGTVTADDDRAINAAVFGTDDVVFNEGNKFEHELIDNNHIKILDGSGSIQGTVFRIPYGEYEILTLDTCATGYKRIDLICATYSKNQNVESVTLEVVKGIETQGIPQLPHPTAQNILENGTRRQMILKIIDYDGTNITRIRTAYDLFSQNILWQGKNQMNASDAVILDVSFHDQKNGIVLVFSPDSSDVTVSNNNIQCFFVPKEAIRKFSEKKFSFFLTNTTFSVLACKTISIGTASLVGNANNVASGAGVGGINYNNAYYALRYVLGV